MRTRKPVDVPAVDRKAYGRLARRSSAPHFLDWAGPGTLSLDALTMGRGDCEALSAALPIARTPCPSPTSSTRPSR